MGKGKTKTEIDKERKWKEREVGDKVKQPTSTSMLLNSMQSSSRRFFSRLAFFFLSSTILPLRSSTSFMRPSHWAWTTVFSRTISSVSSSWSPPWISEMFIKELILGGCKLPGAMVERALGLKVQGNRELFLGGTSQAMLLLPRTQALTHVNV